MDNQTKKQSSDLFSNNSTLQINTHLISMLKNNEVSNTTKKFIQQAINFEDYMFKLTFGQCCICHQRRLIMNTLNGIYSNCQSKKHNLFYSPENKVLPPWKSKKGVVKYTIPPQLQHLTLAEKLLIQRVSPLIPVIHIKNGILGSRGHVVSFFQDITNICSELPRLPSDITMIKVVRTGTTADGENLQNIFNVNRYRILNALLWLKEHNSLYADITIKESNLDWMVGSQSQCLQHVIQVESNNDVEEENDKGPSYHQVLDHKKS